MCDNTGMTYKPQITEQLVEQIKRLILQHPEWNRTRLSKVLCDLWDWRSPAGQIKDISCRDMLRSLEYRGLITLPQPLAVSRQAGRKARIKHQVHETSPVAGKLATVLPIKIDIVASGEQLTEFKSLLDQYHYLGFDRTVGENMKYMVSSQSGAILACLLFGSAAWTCQGRDSFIGWSVQARKHNLQHVTNNTRFLILPWVRVPHLASHILGQIAHRVSGDWMARYGHEIFCLETFVERRRFKGTCYQAANWLYAGTTTGRGRNSVNKLAQLPIKDIYLFPLRRDFRKKLAQQEAPLNV
jgi:hypothetical protein